MRQIYLIPNRGTVKLLLLTKSPTQKNVEHSSPLYVLCIDRMMMNKIVLVCILLVSNASWFVASERSASGKGRGSQRRSRNLGKGKGKGKGSSKKATSPPTISSHPSLEPSPSPSGVPTTSSSPSSIPSPYPSGAPTATPSRSPSSAPTVSSHPSLEPTATPSLEPTSTPSASPSSSPQPSGKPSISSAPTIDTISGKKIIVDANGDEGIQNGCAVPADTSDVEFAQATVRTVQVDFLYLLKYEKNATLDQILNDLDRDFAQYIFDNYITCPIDTFDVNKPIGIWSAPMDSVASDFVCAKQDEDTICLAIEGLFTMLYPTNAGIVLSAEEEAVLGFVKDAIEAMETRIRRKLQETPTFSSSNSDIKEIVYIGKRNEVTFAQGGLITRATGQDEQFAGNEKLSTTGAVLVGSSVIIVLGILFAADRRRKRKKYSDVVTLRNKSGYAEYEADDSFHGISTTEVLTPTSSPDRDVKFPLRLPVVTPGENSNSSSARYLTQNVHHCNSATCQVCQNQQDPEFIHLNNLRDDMEIDYSRASSSTLDFDFEPETRGLHDEYSNRTYIIPNTVTL